MTKPFEPIPPSQLFRALLLHLLDTQRMLTPLVRHTTSVPLKLCHQQNMYILSEIESWLEGQLEDLDLSPEFSAAQCAELRLGVVSCLRAEESPGAASIPTARSVPPERRLGTPRAASSRRSASTPRVWERNSRGQIVFLAQSSNEKPASTSPIPTNDTLEDAPHSND
jgi:hypothetical protein